jgi:5'(3')-deoxyribonucleotidase
MTKKRLAIELGGVNEYMRYHFKARWNVDRDLYMEAIDKNISYLKFIIKNHQKDYRDYLRRGSMVKKLDKKGG